MRVLAASLPICVLLFLSGVYTDSTGEFNHLDAFAGDSTRTSAIDGISPTMDNQILVELMPEDTTPANLFDLNERTLVFTPDGEGGYSREVQPLAWEEHIGAVVADGALIALESFAFDFAGQSWDSFYVSRHGLLTFGGPLRDSGNRFATMHEMAARFVDTPTISPLYKPWLGEFVDTPIREWVGKQHVARWPDRVVVTWITTDPFFYVHGVPPEKPARFQAVLHADGSIRFNYSDVALGDGIVGLFPDDEVVKGDLIASVVDGTNPELPGHIDLLETAIYATNTDTVILEFTTRSPIPEPDEETTYSYRLFFDTDRPWWILVDVSDEDRPWWTLVDVSDEDFTWQIDIRAGGAYTARGRGVERVLASDTNNRVALLADIHDLQGLSASVIVEAVQFDDSYTYNKNDFSPPTRITLPILPPKVDLSQSGGGSSWRHHEVFHYRSIPDLEGIACRVIDILGDRFDLLVFHSEFRVDVQEPGTPWRSYGNTVRGIGRIQENSTPCGEGRLKGRWVFPVWMYARHVFDAFPSQSEHARFDQGLALFAHEFAHVWTAYASYDRNGKREPLFGKNCRCHWRDDLHAPAAFPWHEEKTDPKSLMGGAYWRDNGDRTFTPEYAYRGGGFSWLDLYAMGLADASEVPDMFILRNLKGNGGVFTGDKEIISIDQVIAAEGPREPSAAESQKIFNAGFIYLLEPGKTPTDNLLDLHAEYRDKVVEHWSRITGGRSRITTHVDGVANATLGNPRSGSFQSGIAAISGWACHAHEIVIELNGVPYRAGYGTTRPDTQERCGDTDNGFSLLWNWNNLGPGTHTVRALLDGQEFANTTVRVTTLGEPFLRGVSGLFELPNFPTSGEIAIVQWEEALQNFVITDGSPARGGGYNRVAGIEAILGNPSLGSAQSGVGVISGWACEAEEIVIELNGVPYRAGYGTTRPDTQERCGDTDNGFSLLWNWNNLGPGTHTVRALLDGQEFANTTVRVTTLGEPFLRDVSGTFSIPNFPRSGEDKRLRWEQSLQNFVIVP